MSDVKFLQRMVSMTLHCDHDDTCNICRERRLGAAIARQMLASGDTEGGVLKWGEEFGRQLAELPPLN